MCSDMRSGSMRSATCRIRSRCVLVQAFGTAEREADTMQRYGNIAPNGFQTADRRSATHVVFGMNFHPGHVWACIEHSLMVLEAQSDPGFRRDQIAATGCLEHQLRGVMMP